MNDIFNNISGFIGILLDLIKPLEKKYQLAIGMSLKKILDYVVVQDLKTSYEIGSILKSKMMKKSILILSNAPQKDPNNLS